MHDKPLDGKGILVTRPRKQSQALRAAIEDRGGNAILYPVIEITPHDSETVSQAVCQLPAADVVVFVSRNAAEMGAEFITAGQVAAIGPATAEALRDRGVNVDILPDNGFDSESLLASAALQNVANTKIWIVRGESGRELLGETLRSRGAQVHYLPVYRRSKPVINAQRQDQLRSIWSAGGVHAVTAMSVESLTNLFELLPQECSLDLARLPLVTPATRVIKELLSRHPNAQATLAKDPSTGAMLDAIQSVLGSQR